MLYWETFDVLEALVDGDAKRMMSAIRQYSQYGALPDFSDNAVLNTLWLLLRPKLDADAERYENIREQRRAAVKSRWEKERKKTAAEDNERIHPYTGEYERIRNIPTTTTTATTTATTTTSTTTDTTVNADRGCRGEDVAQPRQQDADSLDELFKFPSTPYKPMGEEEFVKERDRKLQALETRRGWS